MLNDYLIQILFYTEYIGIFVQNVTSFVILKQWMLFDLLYYLINWKYIWIDSFVMQIIIYLLFPTFSHSIQRKAAMPSSQ